MKYYKLVDKEVVECNYFEWAEQLATKAGEVAMNIVGRYRVVTLFLGRNHQFELGKPPLLFETLIFNLDEEELDDVYNRYSTYEEAEIGHQYAVISTKLRNIMKEKN